MTGRERDCGSLGLAGGAVQSLARQDKIDVDILLGDRIRSLRVGARLSQSALGQRIGVSFQQVQKYESGANRISASTLVRIAQILEVPVMDILRAVAAPGEAFDPATVILDPFERELLHAFRKVSSPPQRKAVLELVMEMSKG